ncbi:hypothetical protein DUI87_06263 [Hirundo rustica rustica]|uniref:Uncharacterized protein n=1 Tax=Hirundo rustica rustica TaxID=333673 RepID=A0A3M0KW13_HIRRU|nr:hypothetical protein DUI87_06263 [Hirundo rustica rustica]
MITNELRSHILDPKKPQIPNAAGYPKSSPQRSPILDPRTTPNPRAQMLLDPKKQSQKSNSKSGSWQGLSTFPCVRDCHRSCSPPECPQGASAVSPAAMEPREVLEALVALVATLGELVATVAGPDEDVLRVVSPRSLRAALRKFTWHLHCTLNLRGVTPLGQRDVTSLGQAVAALGANPGASSARARVTAAASAWRELVAALMESWDRLAEDATKLHEDWGNATTRSGRLPTNTWMLLERLVAACDKATVFPWELLRRLGDIELALEGTGEVTPNVPEALVAVVVEAERLWEASSRLTTHHLLGTLGDIHRLLVSHPGGSGGHAVAERCQKAIEDIPRLLGGQ